jgi:DNA transformation protein and related proteins
MDEHQLASLPNLGPALVKLLEQVDIKTPAELMSEGSKRSFKRIRRIDPTACLNSLFALEGAIRGIRWHHLDRATMTELKEFYNSNENQEQNA